MADCVFCKIGAGQIPTQFVWQDEHAVAFRDIRPLAPTHVVIIPRRHAQTFGDLGDRDSGFLSSLGKAIREIAEAEGVAATGYRILSNNGHDGGQEVPHLHLHLLGGRELGPMLVRRSKESGV